VNTDVVVETLMKIMREDILWWVACREQQCCWYIPSFSCHI